MTVDNEIIYLDNNATTQLDPAVIEEMLPFLTKYYGNPSSGYGFAAMARKAINLARERLAALLDCEPTEVVFTSGRTESNNAAINFLSLSAHKFHGPKGVGAVYVDRRTRFGPLIAGGGQENGRRGGTENVASIVGLGKAAELALKYLTEGKFNIRSMRDRFEKSVLETVNGASVNGAGAARLSNTSSLSFEGIESSAALLLLDRQGICCSAGSACRTGSQEASHVLRAMNPTGDDARRSLRFSLGRFNTEAQIDRAIEVVPKVIEKLRQSAAPTPVAMAL